MSAIPVCIQEDLMNCKSRDVYDRWFNRFSSFADDYKAKTSLESPIVNIFLLWIKSLSDEYCSATIWQASSCVNKRLKMEQHDDVLKHPVVKEYLKKLSKNHIPKKASVFNLEHMHRYLREAPNTTDHLLKKAVFIVGIFGGCRMSEICDLTFDDVSQLDDENYSIRIKKSKTDPAGIGHSFMITKRDDVNHCPYSILQDYFNKFDDKSGRIWRKFKQNGTPSNNPIGINTLSKYPKEIANYLSLDGDFSGHSFRRSSATILADNGCSTLQLKRHGRWKSSTVAEGYIDTSKKCKTDISNMFNKGEEVTIQQSQTRSNITSTGIHGGNFYNCHINIIKRN